MSPTPALSRRRLLAAAALLPAARLSFAQGNGRPERFVFIVLRGGMDSLIAVPPVGDPDFVAARGPLADFRAFGTAPRPLSGPFALHPLLPSLHAMFVAREATIVHATQIPYRDRSHFDGQQMLESGGAAPYRLNTGFLGRALAAQRRRGIALGVAVPLSLRGSDQVDTWTPSALPDPTPDTLARVQAMYAQDAALGHALQRAAALRGGDLATAMAPAAPGASMGNDMAGAPLPRGAFVALAQRAGAFLAAPDGPQVAVLELGGWDSHHQAMQVQGSLSNALRQLDGGLAALREALGAGQRDSAWSRTVVVVATEFGRQVAVNGTFGTDHGTGGAAFVLGGAVKGGRVIADWPGLAPGARFEGRDLRATTDLRGVFKNVLGEHLRVDRAALERDVFPDSASAPAVPVLA